ncbi:dimethylaniline monooxygenase [N-oxide-forming] 2 [Microcaecilia unicolor]|uniref:Flavin-containing monooxygenase n=1 Tax=Microcaecilia unicolor TaxID=1415580 RepID=A0A6P7Y8Q5_9AMPH|nr:dimethylaniline monooxygenase [N-oxide-forming] 2-like [Microcaecilia unicolor]
MAKRVAVIGSGTSGLSAIKCCLDEGLEPTCFERSDDIGGLWRFTEKVEDGRASIYRSVVTNTCKEMMCYSDFPMPDHFPNYLHNSKIMEYYRLYAKHFDLIRHIQFKTVVCSVKKCQDFATTGQWEVITEVDGRQKSAIFDAVLVCVGHHVEHYLPLDSFPGIEKFKGQHFHSRFYKTPEEFQGKKVLVVGMGNSGADLAVELSHVSAPVFLSTRRGSWIMSRVYDNGLPWDCLFNTRLANWFRNALPPSIAIWLNTRKMNQRFDHANYGLQPQDSRQWKEPLFNDDLPSRITCGYVMVKPDVIEFTESSAKFEDGTVEENIDVIIFSTGYRYSFPFLDESIIKIENNNASLFKSMFPSRLEKPTLAVLGLIQPLGPIMPTAELQARWATRVFKGLCKFPSSNEIREDIEKKKEILFQRFGKLQGNSLQVDYIEYLDELASEIGTNPNRLSLFLTDPKLALEVFFGACSPFHYRLFGPGKWPGARNAILTNWDRILKATRHRVVKQTSDQLSIPVLPMLLFLITLLVAVFLFY